MTVIWQFIQQQILGMEWLNVLVSRGLAALGVDTSLRFGGSLQFFLYDTIKIVTLLAVLIFIISYIQSYFPPERTKQLLGGRRGLLANSMAALLGTVTPFCSCSSIPLFIGFTAAGLPLSVTFSFLISSPLVDLGSLVLIMSIFGAKVAVAYVLVGLILAVLGGTLIGRLGMEQQVEVFCTPMGGVDISLPELKKRDRLIYARQQVVQTVRKVIPYILIGVAIGAVIHNWIPESIIQSILGKRNPFSVVLAAVVGIPMYADIFGAIPIAEALFLKGVGLGTVLAFMMAVTALSLPSVIMLRRAVKPKLLGIFVGIVSIGIIIIGYLFNALQGLFF